MRGSRHRAGSQIHNSGNVVHDSFPFIILKQRLDLGNRLQDRNHADVPTPYNTKEHICRCRLCPGIKLVHPDFHRNWQRGAKLIIRERILTDGNEWAKTTFDVALDGEDCSADVVSRSVAKGESYQEFISSIHGNNRCYGHSSCDAILAEHGRVNAQPALEASHVDAALIHEAAIGKIAGEQLLKLQTLGLTAEQAEERIIEGFLK